MTASVLLEILDALRNCVDPRTGESFPKGDSRLGDPRVRRHLNDLIKAVTFTAADPPVNISDEVIRQACAGLRELGYEPSVPQLAKVFIGSRSIADRSLKGLTVYNKYRGVYTRDVIHTHLVDFARRLPAILPETPAAKPKPARDPWMDIDFFRTETFDKLDFVKENELIRAVTDLGLARTVDQLPGFKVAARENHPRAFEPWARDEQALLIEAMCYTNDLDRLAKVFGRTARSLEGMGQRLIYESREAQRA
jgi:hypothetical protein